MVDKSMSRFNSHKSDKNSSRYHLCHIIRRRMCISFRVEKQSLDNQELRMKSQASNQGNVRSLIREESGQ